MQTSLRSLFQHNKVEAAPLQAKRKLGRPPKEKPIVEVPADLENEVRALKKKRIDEEVQQLVAVHQGQQLVAVEEESQASESSGLMQFVEVDSGLMQLVGVELRADEIVEVDAQGTLVAANMTKDEWRAQCVKWGALGGKFGRLGGRPRKSEGAKLTPGRKRVRDESFGPQEKLKMCALMHKLESQFEDLEAMAKHMVVLTSRTKAQVLSVWKNEAKWQRICDACGRSKSGLLKSEGQLPQFLRLRTNPGGKMSRAGGAGRRAKTTFLYEGVKVWFDEMRSTGNYVDKTDLVLEFQSMGREYLARRFRRVCM